MNYVNTGLYFDLCSFAKLDVAEEIVFLSSFNYLNRAKIIGLDKSCSLF